MADQDKADVHRPGSDSSPQESPAEGGEGGSKKRGRKRVRIRQGGGSSSGSSQSRRRKKANGSSGITYSIGSDSGISTGYRFWLTGGLIAVGVLVMAYLVLSRLGGPPPIPSD